MADLGITGLLALPLFRVSGIFAVFSAIGVGALTRSAYLCYNYGRLYGRRFQADKQR